MLLRQLPVQPSYTYMRPRPFSFPLTVSDQSPALRLPRDISSIIDTETTAAIPATVPVAVTNFSHPFEPEFESSPFIIPDFSLYPALLRTNRVMYPSQAISMANNVSESKFRPTSSVYSLPLEPKSDDLVESKSPSGSVFNIGDPGPSTLVPGQAITTSDSEDHITNLREHAAATFTPIKGKSIDILDASREMHARGRHITALPSFLTILNASTNAEEENAAANVSATTAAAAAGDEEKKTEKAKRNSFVRLGASLCINWSSTRLRRLAKALGVDKLLEEIERLNSEMKELKEAKKKLEEDNAALATMTAGLEEENATLLARTIELRALWSSASDDLNNERLERYEERETKRLYRAGVRSSWVSTISELE